MLLVVSIEVAALMRLVAADLTNKLRLLVATL